MNRAIFIFLVIGAIIVFSFLISGTAEGGEKVSREIYEKASGGKVKVFVKVKDGSGNKLTSKREMIEDIKKFIGEGKTRHTFENKISAVVSYEDLKNLERNPIVERVEIVGERELFLQESVPLINGSLTYLLKVNGSNLTGIDQSICILDSGVNYTHPDLGGCSNNTFLERNCSKVISGYDYVNDDTNPMDDNGHGTHVAGIAAASGAIRGVAPGAKIVAIKVCNSGGICADDDIAAGIIWCVNNSSLYNISVISMSFGGALFSDYCNSDFLASYINNAVAKNISVTIAAGNGLNNMGSGRADQIASPSCVQNATPISSIDKNGNIASYADRNQLVMLMTPGSLISSTCINGGSCSKSGTSMSAPHAAGAFALVNQFLSLTSQTKTPEEIEIAFNNTGLLVIDTNTNTTANYSKINLYDAIVSLDKIPPDVTLTFPSNGSISLDINKTLECNASDLALRNSTLFLWDSSSFLIYNISQTISGALNIIRHNVTNLSNGNYHWNCLYYDENENFAMASSNFSFSVGGISTELLYPEDGFFSNSNETNFVCQSVSEQNNELRHMTFYLWNSSSLIYNKTKNLSGFNNEISFNFTFLDEHSYVWNCLAFNNGSNFSFSESNYTLTYDVTLPIVNLVSPLDSQSIDGEVATEFQFNVSDDLNITQCGLIFDNVSVAENSSKINNLTNSIFYTVLAGDYIWRIDCVDQANNTGNSFSRVLKVTSPPSQENNVGGSSSGSGGGGGRSSRGGNPNVTTTTTQDEDDVQKKIGVNVENETSDTDEVNESTTLSISPSITGSAISESQGIFNKQKVVGTVMLTVILFLFVFMRVLLRKVNSGLKAKN
jgi:subtilisin family serine protease